MIETLSLAAIEGCVDSWSDESPVPRDSSLMVGHILDLVAQARKSDAAQSRIATLETDLAASRADNARLREASGALLNSCTGEGEIPVGYEGDRGAEYYADDCVKTLRAILASTAPGAPQEETLEQLIAKLGPPKDAPQPDLRAAGMEEAARIIDDVLSRFWAIYPTADEDEERVVKIVVCDMLQRIRAAIPVRAGAPADDGWCYEMEEAPKTGKKILLAFKGYVGDLVDVGEYAKWEDDDDYAWFVDDCPVKPYAWRLKLSAPKRLLPPPPREDAKP